MNDKEITDSIVERYTALIANNGDGPAAVEQADVVTQETRMAELCKVGDLGNAKILDFGCGTGHLYDLLTREKGFSGEYVGYDICPALLDAANDKHPNVRFEQRSILEEGVEEEFDYVLINGVFNNLVGDNWDWMTRCLRILFRQTKNAVAFNNLTRYVDYFDDHLFYVDPMKVFQFCKEELSPCVTLRHDYQIRKGIVPYEFTTYVYKSDVECRKLK